MLEKLTTAIHLWGGDEDTSIKVHFSYDLWEKNGKEQIGVNLPQIYINGEKWFPTPWRLMFLLNDDDDGYLKNKRVSYSLGKEDISIDFYQVPYALGSDENEIYVSVSFQIHLYDDELFDWLYHADFF